MTNPPPSVNHPMTFPLGADLPLDRVVYGPDIPDETDLRLLGNLKGKRVLQLGCGEGHTTVALHRQGARPIVVEPSPSRVEAAKSLFHEQGLQIELHEGDLADLAGVRADSIDLALSIYALAAVEDLPRVFRQVHRVLRPELPLVFSLPHPAFAVVDPTGEDPLQIHRSYWDPTPREWTRGEERHLDLSHTIHELFTGLARTNFRIDALHEPEPERDQIRTNLWSETMAWLPSTLIIRARKQGI